MALFESYERRIPQIQALLDACTEPGQLDEPLRTLVLGE